MALVLIGWHRAGALRLGVVAALAWSALQVYTGVVFVTAGVFVALLAEPLVRREWRARTGRPSSVPTARSAIAGRRIDRYFDPDSRSATRAALRMLGSP